MARKKVEVNKELAQPPVVQKSIIKSINDKLNESRRGNYSIQILNLSDARRSFCSFEYHLDIKVEIKNLNNDDVSIGPVVPGMGPNPIQLGKRTLFVNQSYFDFRDMEEQIFDKVNKKQYEINEEGYWPKKINQDGKEEYV